MADINFTHYYDYPDGSEVEYAKPGYVYGMDAIAWHENPDNEVVTILVIDPIAQTSETVTTQPMIYQEGLIYFIKIDDLNGNNLVPSTRVYHRDYEPHSVVYGICADGKCKVPVLSESAATQKIQSMIDADKKYCQVENDTVYINNGFVVNSKVENTITIPEGVTVVKLTGYGFVYNVAHFSKLIISKNNTTVLEGYNEALDDSYEHPRYCHSICMSKIIRVNEGDVITISGTSGLKKTLIVESM